MIAIFYGSESRCFGLGLCGGCLAGWDLELGLIWVGLVQKIKGIKGRCCGFVASAQGGVDPA
jgi:hypothetical protein